MFVSAGAQNFFNPAPMFRGQPTMFLPGTVYGAFMTPFDGSPLTWTLAFGDHTLTATADGNSPRLGSDPMSEPGSMAVIAVGAAVGGLGRRRGRGR